MMKNNRLLSLLVGLALILCMLPSMAFAADRYRCYVEYQGTIGVEAKLSRNVTFKVEPEKAIVFYKGMNTIKSGSTEFNELTKSLSYEWYVDGEEDTILGECISYTHKATREDLEGKEYVCIVSFDGEYAGKINYVACENKIEFKKTARSFYYEQFTKGFVGAQITLSNPGVVGANKLHYEWWKYDRQIDDYVQVKNDSASLQTKYGDFIDYYYCYISGDNTNYLTSYFVLMSCKEVSTGQEFSVPFDAETKSGYGNFGFMPNQTGVYPIVLNRAENTDVEIRIYDIDEKIIPFDVEKDVYGRVIRALVPFEANKMYEIVFNTNGTLKATICEAIQTLSKCSNCHGRGVVFDPNCELCEGSGDCPTCWGTGWSECCEGTGKCIECEGRRGGCERCGYTGICPICNGSGACATCQGSGICSCGQPCPSCNGDGIVRTLPNVSQIELLTAKTSGDKAVSLSWNRIDGAKDYIVYGQQCGKEYKKIATTTKTTYTVKKIAGKKLKAHKTYKFYVKAITPNGTVKSKSIHFITGKTMGKYANAKSITVKPTSLTLEPGKTATLKATTKIYKNKKHIKSSHGAATRYLSDTPSVATVNANGVVTAVSEGTATIYVQDIGGLWCKTTVTVAKQ